MLASENPARNFSLIALASDQPDAIGVKFVMRPKSMDYALAKALKDAGFPQKRDGPFLFPADHNPRTFKGQRESASVRAFVPTLMELFEAWGREPVTLERTDSGRWHVVCANQAASHKSLDAAIARLWLALKDLPSL